MCYIVLFRGFKQCLGAHLTLSFTVQIDFVLDLLLDPYTLMSHDFPNESFCVATSQMSLYYFQLDTKAVETICVI